MEAEVVDAVITALPKAMQDNGMTAKHIQELIHAQGACLEAACVPR